MSASHDIRRFSHHRTATVSLAAVAMFIVVLHVVGWGTLLAFIVPHHLSVGSRAFGIGAGVTAYSLGMRHAFDADHIAAIDNTTRKLLGEGQRASSVGFWFSFGHSSVVFGLAIFIALGMHSLSAHVLDAGSPLRMLTSTVGAIVSSVFLYSIAILNIAAFYDLCTAFRRMRSGRLDEAQLERCLQSRGLISRFLAPLMRIVRKPGQMYFVGVLFGLGFDTATEIALLVLTGAGAASGLPWYAILCLPVLFAAGMLLFDTIDGSFMTLAYGWALAQPIRKIYYNLVVTGLSIGFALIIGTIEMLGLLGNAFHTHRTSGAWLPPLDLNHLGFAIVGLFVATWAVSAAIWKFGRIEQRWARGGDA